MPPNLEEAERHPSYGLLTFTRINSSTKETLFGSSIEPKHLIRLEIHAASRYRNLSEDRHLTEEILLTADLSPAQFADAITNMNHSNGTPVTLRFVNGDEGQRPPPPTTNLADTFEEEHRQSVRTTLELLDEAISHPRLPAAVRRKIKSARGHLATSVPFLENQFQHQMEQSVTEAKATIEAYATERERLMGQARPVPGTESRPAIGEVEQQTET